MSANYLAFLANRTAKRAFNRPSGSGGGATPIDLSNLPVPAYDDAADIPPNEFGKAGGVLYWSNDGTAEPVIPISGMYPFITASGVGSPEGSVVGNIINMLYFDLAAGEATLANIWIFRGTVGQNTGWITWA